MKNNDAALALGARTNQQHEPAARHNGAQRAATADIDGAPVTLCLANGSKPGPACWAPSSLRQQSEPLRSRDSRRSRSFPEGIVRSSQGIARHDSCGSRLSLCKPADATKHSAVNDTCSFRISDSEHGLNRGCGTMHYNVWW